MGVSFSVDAPAAVGDVIGWSVTEAATQASPVEPVRSTPSFAATAKNTLTTKFATHNGASLTHDKLGKIDGYVRSVNPVGGMSSLDCQTVLNQLNVDAEFSETFFPEGFLSDYVKGLIGYAVTNPPQPPPESTAWVSQPLAVGAWKSVAYGNGVFVAIRQGAAAVSADGKVWSVGAVPTGDWQGVTFGNGRFVAVGFGGTNYAMTSVDGVTWVPQTAPATFWVAVTFGNGLFVALKAGVGPNIMTSPDGVTWTMRASANGNWNGLTYGNGLFVAVAFITATVLTSPDGLTWTTKAAPSADWKSVAYGNGLFVAVGATIGSPVMTSVDGVSWSMGSAYASQWYSVTFDSGLFVAVSRGTTPVVMTSADGVSWASQEAPAGSWKSVTAGEGLFVAVSESGTNYAMTRVTSAPFANWSASNDPVVTYIPWRGNIWQMLNSLLALNGVELVYTSGQLAVRDIGSVVMEIDDSTVINRSITAVDARQSVDVAYREAFIQSGTIYDAYADGNKSYSIGVNEYREDKVVYEVPIRRYSLKTGRMEVVGKTTNAPTELIQPTEAPYKTARPAPGQFVISASDNLPLAPGQFFDYGGKIEVALNPDDPFSFLLKWTGPRTEIPGAPGPYSLTADQHGAFSVLGTAIFASDKTVNVKTGADPAKVTDATPVALSLPFVNSKEDAFKVGAAAGTDLCSTVEELTFSIATNKLEGFGLTPGSIFRYDNAFWRIVNCVIGNTTTQITARYHTTYDDVDTAWSGKTFANFDAAWAAYKFKDFKIEPLRTA